MIRLRQKLGSCGLSVRGQQRFGKTTSIKLPRTKTDCILVIGITNYLFGLHYCGLEAFRSFRLKITVLPAGAYL